MIRPFAVLLTLAGIATATEADAQSYVRRGYSAPASMGGATYSSYYSGPVATAPPARTYSYSYYTLSPLPSRTYVGYKADGFAFHGAPYGHPYDPWTWPMMSGSYGNGMARYYDPPVK
jgi:hypothetical protein